MKDFVISGRSWNSWCTGSGPKPARNMSLLILSLSLAKKSIGISSLWATVRNPKFLKLKTCAKEMKISRVSGLPGVLKLKTCTKELMISGKSRNSNVTPEGPSQLGNICHLSLSLSLDIGNPYVEIP